MPSQNEFPRLIQWRRTRLPCTMAGKSLAIKNSVLACAWYLIGHQCPPDLDTMLEKCRDEAFRFLDESLHSLANQTRGSTKVKRSILIQDHAEHGARIADPETFARALYQQRALELARPPFVAYKHLVYDLIDREYGHLQQGALSSSLTVTSFKSPRSSLASGTMS